MPTGTHKETSRISNSRRRVWSDTSDKHKHKDVNCRLGNKCMDADHNADMVLLLLN